MSTLSQAFIKAYQKQAVIPSPHFSTAGLEGAGAIATSEFAAAATVEESPTHEEHGGDEPGQDSPPGAGTVSTSLSAAMPPTSDPIAAEPETEAAEASVPQPDFTAATLESTAPIGATPPSRGASPEPLRAALEVEQFDWPEEAEHLREAAAESFSAWRKQFLANRSTTLLVTSLERGEGRTTVLLAAARHLALASPSARIVMVDADFERPQLAQKLGVAVQIGWEDAFAGNQPLPEAMVESTADRLTLLALRGSVAARQVLAHSARLTAAIRLLKQHFDFVCLDAGPLADAADMVQSAVFNAESGIDAALVVRDLRQAPVEENAAISRRLTELGVGHWDLVENFVPALA